MSKGMQNRAAVTSAKALRAGQLEDQRKFHNPNMDQEDTGGKRLAEPARGTRKQLLGTVLAIAAILIWLILRAFGVI